MARGHRAVVLDGVIVDDGGRGVEHSPDPVSAVVARRRHSPRFNVFLDYSPDFRVGHPGPANCDRGSPRVVGDLDEAPGILVRLARHEHLAVVAMEAFEVARHVNVDEIAIHEDPVFVRDPVAYHLIDRRANAPGEVAVVERRGVRAPLDRLLMHDRVDRVGRDAHRHRPPCDVQHLAGDAASLARARDVLRAVHGDLPRQLRHRALRDAVLRVVRPRNVRRHGSLGVHAAAPRGSPRHGQELLDRAREASRHCPHRHGSDAVGRRRRGPP
mmetsp:Transcript_67906/g.162139  ORF Transcript_67906/g.162139 Transcript_67906/m.162139 type:complete len:271 (-) Transcript_67906:131-943(-)